MLIMKRIVIVAVVLSFLFPLAAWAVQPAPRITDREIVERLTRLEEGQKALSQRIDGVNRRIDDVNKRIDSLGQSLNKRIDDLRFEMNDRFAAMDKRLDTLQWMLGLFISISLVILGFVLRIQWQLQKRQTALEATLETQKDELAFIRDLIEKFLPPKGVL